MGYFQTARGQIIMYFAVRTAALTLFLAGMLPHTVAQKATVEAAQCYEKNGVPRQLPDKLRRRFERAMDILQLQENQRKKIKPFPVFGFDLFPLGSTKYTFGGSLGIPMNYNYASVSDINCSDRGLRDEKIFWNTQYGLILQDAIILTEDEQMFGICKTILQMQSHNALINATFPSVSFMSAYTLGHYLNVRYHLLEKSIFLRLIMYSCMYFIGLFLLSFLRNFNQAFYDVSFHRKLEKIDPNMLTAGMRYYDKNMTKSIALRMLIRDNFYTGCCKP